MAFVKLQHWYRIVRGWPTDRVIAGAYVVIALCSMVIALSSLVFSVREARMSREHDRLSVKPHLFISFYYDATGVGWKMINDGLGSARVRGFRMLVDGVSTKATEPFPEALRNALKISIPSAEFLNPTAGAIAEGDGAITTLFWVGPGPAADAIHAAASKRIIYEVCYCSIYDECWLFNSMSIISPRDDSCSTFAAEPHTLWWNG